MDRCPVQARFHAPLIGGEWSWRRTGSAWPPSSPGVIQTPILENISDEARGGLLAGISVGRFGDPGEVWLALRFILACGFFTSRVIEVDGGAMM